MDLVAAKMIGAGLAAIALAGAGVGIGIIFGNYLSGAMRNPSAAQKQFPNLLLGFALAEATGLFGLVVALIIYGVTIIGFIKHGFGYLKLFVPSGVPVVLLPLIVVIDVISYLSRPVSLSVRLFANMMAGHTMMKVFGSFVVSLGIVGGWLPLGFSVALTGLEILVAFLQAYVFAILTCIYLNDALNLHH